MSMRTIARSSSNRKLASVLASSVLPTPVGPRNRKLPMGRLGSDSPARERRIAPDTAATASSWPMTRSCSTSSRCASLAISPCMSRETGTPVHAETTSAISSSVTSSLSIAPLVCSSLSCSSAVTISASSCGCARSEARRRASGRPRASRAPRPSWLRRARPCAPGRS